MRLDRPEPTADRGAYTVTCPNCRAQTTLSLTRPVPDRSTLVCANCDTSLERLILSAILSDQLQNMKKLGRLVLMISIPSLTVLGVGVWILLGRPADAPYRGLGVGLVITSGTLLAMATMMALTLYGRRRLIRTHAHNEGIDLDQ